MANPPARSQLAAGTRVGIVTKADQGTGKITEGAVAEILTSSGSHPHGIKVRLRGGQVGRVKRIARERQEPPAGRRPAGSGDAAPAGAPGAPDERAGFGELCQYDAWIEWPPRMPPAGRRAAAAPEAPERLAAAICAMGNKDGGSVHVGARPDGAAAGLGKGMEFCGLADCRNDLAGRVKYMLKDTIRDEAFVLTRLRIGFADAGGGTACVIRVMPADRPLFLHGSRGAEFYVRGAARRPARLEGADRARYIAGRFRGAA